MAENRREVRAVLRYDVDNSSLQKTVASTRQIEAALGKVRGETAATEVTAKRLQTELQALGRNRQIDGIAQDFARAALEGRDLERETARVVERLRALGASEAEIRRVARAYDQAEKEARDFAHASAQGAMGPGGVPAAAAGGARQAGALGRAGVALRNLPSMQIPGAGGLATDAVGNILRVSDTLVASIAGLGPVGIAASVAIVGLTAVTGLYLNEIKKVAEAERERLNLQTSVIAEARRSTREQFQESIAQTRIELNIANDRAQQLGRASREAFNALSPIEQTLVRLGGLGTAISPAATRFAELNDELTENQDKAKQQAQRLQEQNAALDANLTAQNDANEATRQAVEEEKRLADARRATILATADEARQNALENARFAGMSQQQLRAERDRLEADSRATRQAMETILDGVGLDMDGLRASIDRLGLSGEKADDAIRKVLQAQGVDSGLIDAFLAYREELRKNADDVSRLTQTYIPLAGRTEALATAAADAEQALKDMVDAALAVSAQAEKVRDAETALAETRSRANTAIGQAEQRVRDAEAKGETQRLEILRRANDQAAKIGADYGVERVRAEEDLARELRNIERTRLRDTRTAQGERDALAALQANQQAEDAKADAQEQARVEARRRREDYQRRISELAQATSRELQVLRQRTTESVNAARAALEVERQKWQGEISMRQQALNAMLQQYNVFLSALRSAQATASRVVIQPQTVQVPQTGNPYADYAAYQRSQGIPGFDRGLERVPYDGMLAVLHKDETVLNRRQADLWRNERVFRDGRSGGSTLNLIMDGKSVRATSRAEAVAYVAEWLRDMGVA